MHGIIPYMMNSWADPVLHLLLLKSSMAPLSRELREWRPSQFALMPVGQTYLRRYTFLFQGKVGAFIHRTHKIASPLADPHRGP